MSRILSLALVTLFALLPIASAQQFSDWSAPVNITTVNAMGGNEKTDPFLSKDGLSLYFVCNNCPGGYGGYDIYVAQRASLDAPWGIPQNVGPAINTADSETTPALSVDGHRLYFTSTRTDGIGGGDIWVSRRHNKRDDFAWRAPENLGAGINTVANEAAPTLFEDDSTGITTLYFQSDRPGGLGGTDIYASTLQEDETFGPAVLVGELSSSVNDGNPSVRRDGLEIYLNSNRDGSLLNLQNKPSVDIWVSTRASTSDPWSIPVNADPLGLLGLNTNKHEGGAELSFDATALYFHAAQRSGNVGVGCPGAPTCYLNIWTTTREKLRQEQAGDE